MRAATSWPNSERRPKPWPQSVANLTQTNAWRSAKWREEEAELRAENNNLRAEVTELSAWKSAEQRALIEVGVKMMFEGCEGPGLIEGVDELISKLHALRTMTNEHEAELARMKAPRKRVPIGAYPADVEGINAIQTALAAHWGIELEAQK